MALPFQRRRGLEPWALLLFSVLVLSPQAAADEPTLVLLDTADLDTAALLAAETEVEASVDVAEGAFEAPPATIEEAPSEVSPQRVPDAVPEAVPKAASPVAAVSAEPRPASAQTNVVGVSAAAVRRLAGDAAASVSSSKAAILEALLRSVENARSVGLSSSQLVQAESRVKALASEALASAVPQGHTIQGAFVVQQAFGHAESAGVAFSERDAAWVTLRSEMTAVLTSATTAANATRSAQTMHALADSLFVWRKLEFCHTHHTQPHDADMVQKAKEVFEKQVQDSFEKEDLETTALGVRLATEAGAHYDKRAKWWVEVTQNLHRAASNLEGQTLESLLNVVQPAVQFPLNRTAELVNLETLTKDLSASELKHCLNMSAHHADNILNKLDNAKRAGLNTTEVQTAEITARTAASAGLQKALNAVKDMDSVPKIKDAFHSVRRAGVADAEVDAAWLALRLEIRARVVAATAAANHAWNANTIQELATAAFLWRKLKFEEYSMEHDQEVLAAAKDVFEKQLVATLAQNDANSTLALGVRLAGQAGAQASAAVRDWLGVSSRLEEVAASPQGHSAQALVDLLTQCKDNGLPQTASLTWLETTVLSVTMSGLRECLGNSATSLETTLAALQTANDANAITQGRRLNGSTDSSEISAAQTKVQSLALAKLQQAVAGPKNPAHLALIREAFALAERAGVAESEQASARNSLQTEVYAQLQAANNIRNNIQAGRTAHNIQDLADNIFFWRKLKFEPHASMTLLIDNAKRTFQALVADGLQAKDTDFLVLALTLCSKAGVTCSLGSRTWADVAGRVEQAQASIDSISLPTLVALVKEAKDIGYPMTPGLTLLDTTVQSAVAAQLGQTLSQGEL